VFVCEVKQKIPIPKTLGYDGVEGKTLSISAVAKMKYIEPAVLRRVVPGYGALRVLLICVVERNARVFTYDRFHRAYIGLAHATLGRLLKNVIGMGVCRRISELAKYSFATASKLVFQRPAREGNRSTFISKGFEPWGATLNLVPLCLGEG